MFLFTTLQLWTLFFLALKLVEILTHGHLSHLLQTHNIRLHFLFISFYTTRLNSPLIALARRTKRYLSLWFSSGALLGLIGLLLSLLLLSANLYLSLLDFLTPLPPSPQSIPPRSSAIPPRLHHIALSLSSPHAPVPRFPLLHHSKRPWFLPTPYWHRLSPRDHSSSHIHALSERARRASLHPLSRRFSPSALYDFPPPMPRHAHLRKHLGHFPTFRDPFRPPCRKHQYTLWNRNVLPPPALPNPSANNLTLPTPPSDRASTNVSNAWENTSHKVALLQKRRSNIRHHSNRRVSRRTLAVHGPLHPQPDEGKVTFQANETAVGGDDVGTKGTSAFTEGAGHGSFLTPLVPGVTVPAGDIWYMVAAVMVAAVVHELGHALAAGMQNGRVDKVGGFLAVALPGAYVELGGVEEMGVWSQLKVYCAGAWHNLVCAVVAVLMVGWLPALMAGGYAVESGALVVGLPEDSVLKGHIEVGDIVLKLGRFDVVNGGLSFRRAVSELIFTRDSVGFCVPEELYLNFSRPKSACCREEYLGSLEAGEELRQKCFRVDGVERRLACIDPEVVSTQPTCRLTMECIRGAETGDGGKVMFARSESGVELEGVRRMEMDGGGMTGDELGMEETEMKHRPTGCFIPVLPVQQQLVDVRVRKVETGDIVHFFYEGYPQVLGRSVSVSSYVPRVWGHVPVGVTRGLARADLPNGIERLLQYLSSISLALAILNMAPVLFLDGEASSVLFVRLLLPGLSKADMERVKGVIVSAGSVLLLLNLLVALLEVETLGSG